MADTTAINAAKVELQKLTQLAAGDPIQAARVAGRVAELVQWLVALPQTGPAVRIVRVPGFAAIANGAASPLTPVDFSAAGTIVGVRGVLLGVAIDNAAYTQVGLNFDWGEGSGVQFCTNGQGQDFVAFAVLFAAAAAIASPQVWYPLDIPITPAQTKIGCTVQNNSGGDVTPDVYFAFRPNVIR